MQHVVIGGAESPLGTALADRFDAAGARVTRLALDGPDAEAEADRIASQRADIVVFADRFEAPAARAADLDREGFRAGLDRLAFLPFQLAIRMRPSLSAGGRIVLLTRSWAGMTEPDRDGRYYERPFRAAAHALWRCLSVDWRDDGIAVAIIAVDDASQVDRLLPTIAALTPAPAGCPLLDADGRTLGW